MYRERGEGLGKRVDEGPVKGAKGVTKEGYKIGYIDYTTHVEYVTVDEKNFTVINVRVEKKKQ